MENKEKKIKELLNDLFIAIKGQVFASADLNEAKESNEDYGIEYKEKKIKEARENLSRIAKENINVFSELCEKLIEAERIEKATEEVTLDNKDLQEMFELFNSLGDCVPQSTLIELYKKHCKNKRMLEYLDAFIMKYKLSIPNEAREYIKDPSELIKELKNELVDMAGVYTEKRHYESAILKYKEVCEYYGVNMTNGILGLKEAMRLNILY